MAFNLGNFAGQLSQDELSSAFSNAGGNPADLGFEPPAPVAQPQARDTEVAGPARGAQSPAVLGLNQQTAKLTADALQSAKDDEQARKTKLLSTAASVAAAYFTGGASLAAQGASGAAAGGAGGAAGGILGGLLGGKK